MSKEPAFDAKGGPVGTLERRAVPAKLPHRKDLTRWSAWKPDGELLGTEYKNRDTALCALIVASQIDPWLASIRK